MFCPSLEQTLNQAFRFARESHHEYLTVEHLALALLDNPDASEILRACSANVEGIRLSLATYIKENVPSVKKSRFETQPTLGLQRVLQRSIFQVQASGSTEVTGANVLAALFNEKDAYAVQLLNQYHVTRYDVISYLSSGNRFQESQDDFSPMESQEGVEYEQESGFEGQKVTVDKFATNLNEKVKKGEIDPLIGRTYELNRVVQTLCRRRKNNPLIVGEPGVGKTAIAEGLAYAIENDTVPDVLKGVQVYTLDLGAMLAGTKYRGDFEKRFKQFLALFKTTSNRVLFIDEIHTIVGAGAASGGAVDAANLLKPVLSKGELRCIGATTYQEYRNIMDKDRALSRRFQKIDVEEASDEETLEILKGLKSSLEKHHHVRYSDVALKTAVEYASRYIRDRFLPDKAIDIIDEAGAQHRMMHPNEADSAPVISKNDIVRVVSMIARIPASKMGLEDKKRLKDLGRELKTLIFGQSKSIDQVVSAVTLSRSGLMDDDKPLGSFLFTGPTGVGKTELCKQLADMMGLDLIRFDMSEYMEKHAVSRLIGAPPGYVGYDQGGLLTEGVIKQPYAVLLLDEIEKAHPDIFNVLLQIMDYGTLTDNNGRKADFRHIILIMTSNAGAELYDQNQVGFVPQAQDTDGAMALKNFFSPEFRNRCTVVQFDALSKENIVQVVEKCLIHLEVQVEKQKYHLEVTNEAKQWLVTHGYDPKMGARPMERLIDRVIKQPLAEKVLFEKGNKGRHVCVDVKNDEIVLSYEDKKSMIDTEH